MTPWSAYAHGSEVEHFALFCREHLVQSVDEWDGRPLELEPWQVRMMGEALAYDEHGAAVWSSVVIVLPRKNGKTLLLAAYAVYRLLTSDGSPEILLAASSDKQASRLFDACATFIRRNPTLKRLARVRDHAGEIRREDGVGVIFRLSSDPGRLHGYNPSLVIADELAQWVTPSLKRAYAALTSGGGARSAPQTFSITTAGEAATRHSSILGRLLDAGLAADDVERTPGLDVCRMAEARTLVFNHSAPTTDPHDTAAMKLANPASWITEAFLARQAANPELTDADTLQLHGCVWAEGLNAWISAEAWARCQDAEAVIPGGAVVTVGVDVALVHDTTAVAVAWNDGDRIVVESHVFTVNRQAVADELLPGEAIDLERVEEHIRALGQKYVVAEIAYDPRFFERSAQLLADEFVLMPVHQSSAPMADAYQAFYAAVLEGRVAHAGGKTLSSHVMGTAAERTDRGWKIRKMRQSQHIDACVSAVMGVYRAEQQSAGYLMVLD